MEKSYELKPTKENILNTYKNDGIKRNEKINNFINILCSINDNCSIAINGEWGSGKTFFVKQVECIINSINNVYASKEDIEFKNEYLRNNTILPNKQRAIYYDAWKHDDEEDPIYSLIFAIVKDTNTEYDNGSGKKMFNLLKNVVDIVTSKNISSLLSETSGPDDMKKARERISLKDNFAELLHNVIVENFGRLIIIVDELDRCCPSFAVKMLERIKHYFDDELITFVFSTNIKELECTIKTYYGQDFDATAYLNRFFDFIIEIPDIDVENYVALINNNNNTANYFIYKYRINLAKKYNLSMREMAKYLRMINITVDINKATAYGDATFFYVVYIVPIIIILRIVHFDQYIDFINGKNGDPFIKAMMDNDDNFAHKMLLIEGEETFRKQDLLKNIKEVDKRSRLMELYNAIFNDSNNDTKYVGQMSIGIDAKEYIMNITNIFSTIKSI